MAVEQVRILRVQGRAEGMEMVTGALEKVAGASVKVTRAADGTTIATEAQTRKVLSLTKQYESYQSRTDLAARAQQQFARDISMVTRFYEQGTIGASRYADEVDRVKSTLQGAGVQSTMPKIDQSAFNESLGITKSVQNSAKEAAAAFETEFAKLEVIARQRAEQIGQNFQQGLNDHFGVGSVAKSARDSAAAFAAELDRMDEIAQQKAVQIGRNFQEELNRSFGIGGGGAKAAGATFSALEEQLNRFDAIATAKAAHIAQVTQQGLNDAFGIGTSVKSARDSASAFEEMAQAEDAAANKAARLRSAINPLEAEFSKLGKEMADYKRLMNSGFISAEEFGQAQLLAGKRLSDFEKNLKNGANAGRVMSGEIVNLSYQLNDVVTGLALGQSPFMILGQQGGQIFQIFQNSKASVVDFAKEAGSRLVGFLSVGRLVFGGVAASVGAAALALNDYSSAQSKVAMSLTGAGRASGSSISSINQTAEAGSSLTGLSVAEARNLAAALAATGKVANDNILPIVRMGKDIATAFGTDAVGATELLAKSFADPVRGAEDLNQRLGFMDAAMQRNISNLVAQNRLWDAQKMLASGVVTSLADVNSAVGTSTKFWTALGNIISNAWDKVGEGASRLTGIGLKLGLDEQIKNATDRIKELEAISSRRYESANKVLGTTALLETERAKLDELKAAYERVTQATADAQQRQFSFAQASAVRNQQPAIDQIEKLRNENELLVRTMVDVQTTGGAASDILKKMGMTYEQLAAALSVANGNMKSFKTEFQSSTDALKIANDAITAFSPSSKGDIARRQSIESTISAKMSKEQKDSLADQAAANATKQATTALSEAARQRILSAEQGKKSAQEEIDLVGLSIQQQNERRANLASYQQLEQEASTNRTKFDQAQYERLKKINAEQARLNQLRAEKQLGADIGFERSQIGKTDSDAQINTRLRSTFGDAGMNTAQAEYYRQQLKINDSLKVFSDTGREAVQGFASDFRNSMMSGASAWESFAAAGSNALNKIADKLLSMAMDNLWSNAFGGSSSGGGLGGILGGILGMGGSNPNAGGAVLPGSTGNISVGSYSMPQFATGTDYAPGGLAMINEGGRGEIVDLPNGSRVIPHDVSMRMAAASNDNGSGSISVDASDNRTIHIGAGAGPETVAALRAELAADRAQRKGEVINIVRQAQKSRMLS